jgi:hypothetical protein
VFLRFFRSSFATQYIFIGIIGLVFWIPAFITPVPMPVPDGTVPGYALIYALLSGTPRLAAILGFVLVLGSAVLLNYIFNTQEVVTKNSSLAAFLFMILASYYPALLTIHPVSIAIFILLLIFQELFRTYHESESLELFFSAGFYAGLGSLIYFPFLFFFAFIILSFIIFRSNNWREWTASLIGLLTPYVFLGVFYFWFDELSRKVIEYGRFFRFPETFRFEADRVFMTFTGILVCLLLFSFSRSLNHLSEKTIEGRKKNLLLYWSVFIILLSFPFSGAYFLYHPQYLALVVSVLLTSFFLQHRKTFWFEFFILIFFLAILLNNLIFSHIQ